MHTQNNSDNQLDNDYIEFVIQKYSAEHEELLQLINSHKKLVTKYDKAMNIYKVIVLVTSIPNYLFTCPELLCITFWRLITNIDSSFDDKLNQDDYILIKLNEALDIVLNGYQLSDQERSAFRNIGSLPRTKKIEKFIYKGRLTHMQSYLQKKLLPHWIDRLSPECIKFVNANIENGIKATNEFIAKEDLIRQVYFVEPRPLTWRKQLMDAGIQFDNK